MSVFSWIFNAPSYNRVIVPDICWSSCLFDTMLRGNAVCVLVALFFFYLSVSQVYHVCSGRWHTVWIECTLCGFVTGLSTGSPWDNGISHNSLLWQDFYPHNKKGNPYRLQHVFWQLQTVWISSVSHSLDREQAWLGSCPHEQCLLLCTSAWPKYPSDFLFHCQ